MLLTVISIVIICILLAIYCRGKYNQNYWTTRGVVFYERHKTGGPLWEFIIGKKSLFEIFRGMYKEYDYVPVVGFGSFVEQALYIRDPVNIHHITQVDFHSFYHRGIPTNDVDKLANSIVFLNGPKWKLLRYKMTPLFTSAKLKNMYYIIDKSAQDFVEYLKQNPDKLKGDAHETHDTISRFCTAAVSAAVFGIGTRSTFDLPFRNMVKKAISPTIWFNLKFAIGGVSDKLFKLLGLKFFGEHEEFFIKTIKQVIRQREEDGVPRHDFADMCVKLKKEGTMRDPDTGITLEFTDEVLAAQAFFFFLAGVDPSAAAMFVTLMELGRHSDVRKRAHEEVDAVFVKYDNKLTYDAVSEAEYLDRVLSESMRMYPPLGFLSRQCMKDTVLPNGNIPVEKGVKVFLPIYDLHHDPKYFPNPEVFDPDRFLKEGEINSMTYAPFGKGNRYCIGARYARLQLLSGLMHFLRHYTVKTSVHNGGIEYMKEPVQVRLKNVDLEFIPRN